MILQRGHLGTPDDFSSGHALVPLEPLDYRVVDPSRVSLIVGFLNR
jgi:hypothetical protein